MKRQYLVFSPLLGTKFSLEFYFIHSKRHHYVQLVVTDMTILLTQVVIDASIQAIAQSICDFKDELVMLYS